MSDAVQTIPEDTLNTTYGFYANWVPTADQWNAMFGYKVDAIGGSLTNPIVLGLMTLTQSPGGPNDAANKAYVDAVLGEANSLPDAPSDGTPYCRMNAGWVPAPTTITASVTGDLVVPGNLSVGLNATILGNLQLGNLSHGSYKLDVTGNVNVSGLLHVSGQLADDALVANFTDSSGVFEIHTGKWYGLQWFRDTTRGSGAGHYGQFMSWVTGTNSWELDVTDNTVGTDQDLSLYYGNNGTTWAGLQFFGTTGNLYIGDVTNVIVDAGYKLDVLGGGRFVIDGVSQSLDVTANPVAVAGGSGTLLHLIGANNASARLMIDTFISSGGWPQIVTRAAGGTAAAPTAVVNAATLGQISFTGYDGTAYAGGASIIGLAAAAWVPGSHPTRMGFYTVPTGSVTVTEQMRLQQSGNLSIGVLADAGYKLDVAGNARFSIASIGTGPVVITNGATSYPAAAIDPTTLALLVNSGSTGACLEILSFGFAPGLVGAFAGGTVTAPTAVASGVGLNSLTGVGFDGTNWTTGAGVFFRTTEAWTPTAHGCGIRFNGISTGATVYGEWARLMNANLLIGTTTDTGYRLQVAGSARCDTGAGGALPASVPASVVYVTAGDGVQPVGSIVGFGGPSANLGKPILSFMRAGGTRAAPVAVASGANLGAIYAYGYGATTFGNTSGIITFAAGEAFTDTAHGTFISFATTPLLSVTSAEAMRVAPSGNLLIGTTTDNNTDKLQITGSARVSGGLGMFAHVAPTVQPAFSGAKGGNTALASVIAILVAMGVATDTTTA